MVTAFFIISEFRFGWVEKMVGSYLSATNDSRPEIGAIWEIGRQASSAHEFLNRMIDKKQDAKENVEHATSFSFLFNNLEQGEWVTLEKQQFKTLYLSLDPNSRVKIIEPVQLIWLLKGYDLDRIFCEAVADGLQIYFLDTENRVIRNISLGKEEIREIEAGEKPFAGTLDSLDGFSGRIYPAERFFDALFKLPVNILPDLMIHPETLLEKEGRMLRVGISNEAIDGYIRMGFEFRTDKGVEVVFLSGREWAVWQLSLNLKGGQE